MRILLLLPLHWISLCSHTRIFGCFSFLPPGALVHSFRRDSCKGRRLSAQQAKPSVRRPLSSSTQDHGRGSRSIKAKRLVQAPLISTFHLRHLGPNCTDTRHIRELVYS